MKKFLLALTLICVILSVACTDRDTVDNGSSSDAGSVKFTVNLSSVRNATRSATDTPDRVVDYETDFQVGAINVYLFNAGGELVKTYINIENHLSQETFTTDITLTNVPVGDNQTLLCVVNPSAFKGLENPSEDITLEQMLRLTSNPVGGTQQDALMFMIAKHVINVRSGAMTNVSGALHRGVARLDVFSVDSLIKVDSVRVIGTASKSYMMVQEGTQADKVSFTKELDTYEGRSKVTYLNEISSSVDMEVYLTKNGAKGVVNIRVPTVTRNNIYSINLEVANGTHLVTGTLSITPWQNNVLEGTVTSDVSFDRDATITSFRMNDGGSVSMENDTTLLLPGGTGVGLLCFSDGAEVAAVLANPQDTAMIEINRNAATRGVIKTFFDINVKALPTTAMDSLREAGILVSNLMTGKQRMFIIRQKSAGYKEVNVPVLNFANSHQYVANLALEGIASVGELTMPADKYFEVSATKQASGIYGIIVKKKRIYDIVPSGRQLVVTRLGKKAVVLRLALDKGFTYGEVKMGSVTFMDRDLGASDVDHTGELFIPGSLIPLGQVGFRVGEDLGFVGQGRVDPASVSHNYTTKWFTLPNGEKNIEIDPCPDGWHVPTLTEYQQVLTYVVSSNNPIINQGSLGTSVSFDASTKSVNVVLENQTLKLKYTGGYFNRGFRTLSDWPCGWWTSTKNSEGKFNHLAFCVINSPHEVGLRLHGAEVSKVGFNIRCVKDNSSAPPTIPTVRIGGKEWMAFNSIGKGNSGQLLCHSWENVEDIYRKEWSDRLGMLFQWGRKYPHNQWAVYTNNPGGETNLYDNWNSKPQQVPCPDGFRIPTREEMTSLLPSVQLPMQAAYLCGGERVRTSLHSAMPATVSGWHGYSGQARYLKITSVETGNYLIFPLSGDKPDKSTSSNIRLGQTFRLWLPEAAVHSGRGSDFRYEPLLRDAATPSLSTTHPKEAYDYVRCIKE